jgi:hypothetical protein
MCNVTNQQRAAWAKKALATFTAEVFFTETPEVLHPEDLKDALSDLICDLMHLANQLGMDADAVAAQAQLNYEAEIAEAV